MPLARKVQVTCPRCGKNDDVWMFEKEEGDERDNLLFRVDIDKGPVIDFRWRDLRPPSQS